MKSKLDLALVGLSILMIALGLTACGPKDSGSAYSAQDEAWAQAYYDVQNSRRPQKTYDAIDYTRSLYFSGQANLEQTQQRLFMILQTSRALHLSSSKINRFVALAVDGGPHYRALSASDLYRRYVR